MRNGAKFGFLGIAALAIALPVGWVAISNSGAGKTAEPAPEPAAIEVPVASVVQKTVLGCVLALAILAPRERKRSCAGTSPDTPTLGTRLLDLVRREKRKGRVPQRCASFFVAKLGVRA